MIIKVGYLILKNSRTSTDGMPPNSIYIDTYGLLLNSCYTWQYLTLDSLEESTTTCRDIRYLVSQTELVDTSYRVATTDE